MTKPKIKDFNYVSSKKYDGMMGRCYRTKDPSYANYGGRGIRVSGDWIKDINQFRAFLLRELENKNISIDEFVNSSAKFQLDRINVDGHYTAENCRLVSPQSNVRNRRASVLGKSITSAEGEVIEL